MTYDGRINTNRFIEVVKRLRHNISRKIFLIADGHPVHKLARVRQYVQSTQGQLTVTS